MQFDDLLHIEVYYLGDRSMFITTSRSYSVQFALILVFSMVSSVFGLDAIVDETGGPETDGYAIGRFVDGGTELATWSLDTSVSTTDFVNDAIEGGPSGLQYVMLNQTQASTDSNSVVFTANSATSDQLGISIMQSPYNSTPSWNLSLIHI